MWLMVQPFAQPLATTLRAQKLLPPTYEEDHALQAGWLPKTTNNTKWQSSSTHSAMWTDREKKIIHAFLAYLYT